MSSACVCHTEEWCFYCNMYVPLERKYEQAQQEIERLTDEVKYQVQRNDEHHTKNNELVDKLQSAVEALEYYADKGIYQKSLYLPAGEHVKLAIVTLHQLGVSIDGE